MSKGMICNKNIKPEWLIQRILLRTQRFSVSGYLLPAIFHHCSSLYGTKWDALLYASTYFHKLLQKQTLHFFSQSYHASWNYQIFLFTNWCTENCFKKNIEIYINTVPTCFGAITIIKERIFELAKVTFVKIIN